MDDVPSHSFASPGSFRLGSLRVDPSIGIVQGEQSSLRLEPRVMALLVALARRPGMLVSRQELLAEIWRGGDVYDEALTQCVYQLRQQLVSAGGVGCRDLVSTIPKSGYRLNSNVVSLGPPETREGEPPNRLRHRVTITALVVSVLAVLLAWALHKQWTGAPPPAAVLPHNVAVLPFLPLVESDRDPVLELGMADTLITRLSSARQIVVRPVSSVRQFTELDRDVLRVARQLGVDSIVDGSIQRVGDDVRVSARLLRASDGAALWADTFGGTFPGIFSLQDAICERIVAALAIELGQRDRQVMKQGGTSDTLAYELYLQGRFHLARLTPSDLLASVGYFRRAVERDPEYAHAWLGLAIVQFRIPIAGQVPPLDYYPDAKRAVQRALEIDPGLAEGYAVLGWIAHWYEWDWAGAEDHFKHAIELNPNDTESHLGYAQLLVHTQRVDQALTEVRRARELSPLYMLAAALEGGILMRVGRVEDALQSLQNAVGLDQTFWLTRVVLAAALSAKGRGEEALAEVRTAYDLSGSTWARAVEIGHLARLGRQTEAEALLEGLERRASEIYVPPYDLAVANRALGHDEAALSWLERAYQARDPKIAMLGDNQGWDALRGRPEFADLMRRLNFPDPPSDGRAQELADAWSIRPGPVEFEGDESGWRASGSFSVDGPEEDIASLPQGGGCLMADLVPSGIGAAQCQTNAECNTSETFDLNQHPERADFHGYCAARDGSDGPARCWTRPGRPDAYCKRSIDSPLIRGRNELGPVDADPLKQGQPLPEWAVYTCLARPGYDRACGGPENPNRRISMTPRDADLHD